MDESVLNPLDSARMSTAGIAGGHKTEVAHAPGGGASAPSDGHGHQKGAMGNGGGHHWTERELELMNQFESLDYETPYSVLYERGDVALTPAMKTRVSIAKWWIFGLTGFLTGTLAFLLAKAVEALNETKFALVTDSVHRKDLLIPFVLFTSMCVGFVLISSLLVTWVSPKAAGSGIPPIKAYLNGTFVKDLLTLDCLVTKVVGVVFSVSGGLAIGKEGPVVHSGSIIAASLSHGLYLDKIPWLYRGDARWWINRFRNDRDKRDFISGGAAAGVAAAFGAPVGGILFALEEAASFWSIDLTWRVFLACMLSTLALNAWKLADTQNWVFSGLISFGPPLQGEPYRLWETPFFILLAAFGGVHGGLFNYVNEKICHWRRDVVSARWYFQVIEVVVVGFVTAFLMFWAPYAMDRCDNIPSTDIHQMKILGTEFFERYRCEEGQFNTMASVLFTTTETSIRGFFHNTASYDPNSLVVYYIIIFFLSVITYGIAVPSGLFVPCILMGCAYGRLIGELLRSGLGDEIVPGTYALIGAVSSLGGVSRMTISLTVILLETTNDIQFVMPIMITLMVSKWVGDLFNISLYDLHLELACMPFVEAGPSGNLYHQTAGEVMVSPVVCLPEVVEVRRLLEVLRSNTHNGFPVVSLPPGAAPPLDTDEVLSKVRRGSVMGPSEANSAGKLQGIILRSQLAVLLSKRAFGYGEEAIAKVQLDHFNTPLNEKRVAINFEGFTENELSKKVDLRPFVNKGVVSVVPDCPMSRVFTLFRSLGLRHLPIVDQDFRPTGIITRKNIMASFDADLF